VSATAVRKYRRLRDGLPNKSNLPFATFKVDPMNGPEARERGLRLNAAIAPRTEVVVDAANASPASGVYQTGCVRDPSSADRHGKETHLPATRSQ
jgi:hypothetical protein